MNNYFKFILLLGSVVFFGFGCATNLYPGGPTPAGVIYTETTSPTQCLTVATDSTARPLRRGEASTMGFFGLFAFGDAGVDAAMKDGSISKVHHVDHTVQHFLYMIFQKDKTIVYGE